jgi:glutamate/aspartate transport system substrate-binding protein
VGYSIDLGAKDTTSIKEVLRWPDARADFRPVAAAERMLLRSATINIDRGGNTTTMARQRDVDHSFTLFTTGARFLVHKPLEVERLSALTGAEVAVTRGITAEDVLKRFADRHSLGVVAFAPDPDGESKRFDTDMLRIPMNVYMKDNIRFPDWHSVP